MVFDADFYRVVLPERVTAECQANPERIPVVELHLADGSRLDLCHITALAERWFAVAYLRDPATCDDMDEAFLPYQIVTRVTVSLHHPGSRRVGFDVATSRRAATTVPAGAQAGA